MMIAIFGPTASGKSAVAEAVARRIPADLVSADVTPSQRPTTMSPLFDGGTTCRGASSARERDRIATASAIATARSTRKPLRRVIRESS